ncbi:MAG: hypothetical protein AAB692_05495 [Patescibacteria group bacterium]
MRWFFVLFCLPACLPGHQDTRSYTFAFMSHDLDGGALPVPRNEVVSVEVTVRDTDNNFVLIDPLEISWSAGDKTTLDVNSFDGHAWIKGRQDWFDTIPDGGDVDAGHEPATDLTVRYHGSSGSIQVNVIINAQGRWRLHVDNDASQDVSLSQSGRSVRYDLYGFSGEINDNIFTFSGMGYDLTGVFVSRDRIEGTYINHNKNTTGPWIGERL